MIKTTKILTLLCCCFAFALGGCASSRTVAAPKQKAEPIACIPVQAPVSVLDLAPVTPAPVTPPATVALEPAKPAQADERYQSLATVNFGFDSFVLDATARKNLEQFFLSVKDSPARLTLEGYCDERGDDEYNLGLADHRSTSVRKYLAQLGLDPELLNSVGYGREYPANAGHDEKAWQLNRRVEIVKEGAPKPGSRKRYGTEE